MLLNSSRYMTRETTFSQMTKSPQLNKISSRSFSSKSKEISAVRRDHSLVKYNIDRMLKITDQDERHRLFNDTVRILSQHDVAKEVVIYPAVKKYVSEDKAKKAIDQNVTLEKLLYDMDQKFGKKIENQDDFKNHVEKLKKLVSDHIEMEEKEILKKLESELNSDDIDSLNSWFERTKYIAPTRPHPDGPRSAAVNLATGPVIAFIDKLRDSTKNFSDKDAQKKAEKYSENYGEKGKIGEAVDYVKEKVIGKKDEAKYEIHSAEARNSDQSLGERVQAGAKAVKDKASEMFHDSKAEYNRRDSNYRNENSENTEKGKIGQAVDYVKDKVTGNTENRDSNYRDSNYRDSNERNENDNSDKGKIGQAVDYVKEKLSGKKDEAKYNVHSAEARYSNESLGDRGKAGAKAVGDKASEMAHDAKAGYHKSNSEKGKFEEVVDYVKEKVTGKKDEAKYDVHSTEARNSDQTLGERVQAGAKAAKDKASEMFHDAKAESNKDTKYRDSNYRNENSDNSEKGTLGQAVDYVKEKVTGKKDETKYDVHSAQAKDSDKPLGDRVQAGAKAVKDKAAGIFHDSKAEYQDTENVEGKFGEGVNYVKEKMTAKKEEAKYNVHAAEAKDSDKPILERVQSGAKAVKDKASEMYHDSKAEYHKKKGKEEL